MAVRFVDHPGALGDPDLVVLPGTKATVADLDWLRRRGFDEPLSRVSEPVLGICGGYQMLGRRINDPVERRGATRGPGCPRKGGGSGLARRRDRLRARAR